MLMTEENAKAMERAVSAAERGRVRCKKCGKRFFSIFQICECGGRATMVLPGCVCVEEETLFERLGV